MIPVMRAEQLSAALTELQIRANLAADGVIGSHGGPTCGSTVG
jgi:hypothetical protein